MDSLLDPGDDDEEERGVEEVDEAGLRFAYVVKTLMRARL